MGIKERQERERLGTREAIIEAARALFTREGYDRVSMRKIADKAEYTATAIYGHFRDKDELFLEICHEDFRRLAQAFQQIGQIADPIERMRKTGHAYIEFGLKNPNHYRTMFMTPHPQIPDADLQKQGKGNPEEDAYEFLRATVAEAVQAGAFREEFTDPDLIAQTVWAGVHGVISLQIAKCEDAWVSWRPVQERAEAMIDSQLRGLLRREE